VGKVWGKREVGTGNVLEEGGKEMDPYNSVIKILITVDTKKIYLKQESGLRKTIKLERSSKLS